MADLHSHWPLFLVEIEEETGQEFEKENSEGNLVPTSLEVGKLLARLFLPVL